MFRVTRNEQNRVCRVRGRFIELLAINLYERFYKSDFNPANLARVAPETTPEQRFRVPRAHKARAPRDDLTLRVETLVKTWSLRLSPRTTRHSTQRRDVGARFRDDLLSVVVGALNFERHHFSPEFYLLARSLVSSVLSSSYEGLLFDDSENVQFLC